MRIIEIIQFGLNAKGFDGLVNVGVCGCSMADLSPADCLSRHCQAAYLHRHSNGVDWVMSTTKDRHTDDEIDSIIATGC